MWLVHKSVHITTLIGHGELDQSNPPSLKAQDPLSSMDLGTFQKKRTHTSSRIVSILSAN